MLQQLALVNSRRVDCLFVYLFLKHYRAFEVREGGEVNLKVIDTQVSRCLPFSLENDTEPNGIVFSRETQMTTYMGFPSCWL